MCCVLSTLLLIGPRATILVWWLVNQQRWNLAFDNFLWALVGFLFAPWTTLAYVLVFPQGITGFDYIWLAIGLLMDLSAWFGGGYSNRRRWNH